jgi:penicillin-binding protein-related factor A (putative recombinase)
VGRGGKQHDFYYKKIEKHIINYFNTVAEAQYPAVCYAIVAPRRKKDYFCLSYQEKLYHG